MSIAMLIRCDLYVGDLASAWQRYEDEWPRFRRSPFYRTPGTRARVAAAFAMLCWRLLDADESATGVPARSELLARGRSFVRLLRSTKIAWAGAEAELGDAVLAVHGGEREVARMRLERAKEGFAAQGMRLRAHAGDGRRAELEDDSPGLAAALRGLAACGIACPRPWLDAFAGGHDA